MKRQLSLLMLVSRSQLYRAILILAAMAAAQLGLALWGIQHLDVNAGVAVEKVLDWWPVRWTAAVAMAGLFVCLGAVGRRGGRVDYTWYRLPISNVARDVWPMVFGVLVFLIVWAVQLAVAVSVVSLYGQLQPERYHQQTLFLAAYRSSYFHGLLPLEDGWRWAVTIFRYLGLGLYGGITMIRSVRGKRTIHPFVSLIAMTIITSALGSYEWDTIVLGVLWFMLCIAIVQLPGRAEPEEEEETL